MKLVGTSLADLTRKQSHDKAPEKLELFVIKCCCYEQCSTRLRTSQWVLTMIFQTLA